MLCFAGVSGKTPGLKDSPNQLALVEFDHMTASAAALGQLKQPEKKRGPAELGGLMKGGGWVVRSMLCTQFVEG